MWTDYYWILKKTAIGKIMIFTLIKKNIFSMAIERLFFFYKIEFFGTEYVHEKIVLY